VLRELIQIDYSQIIWALTKGQNKTELYSTCDKNVLVTVKNFELAFQVGQSVSVLFFIFIRRGETN
jgi:hypothetical protein